MTTVVQAALLTLVYALALASFAPLDLALGAVLSAATLYAIRRLHAAESVRSRGIAGRMLALVPLVAVVVRLVVVGTWTVALVVLGLRSTERAGLVAVPFGGRSPSGVAATAVAFTLAPGDLVVDVSWQREEMLVHALDARDPDAVRERYQRFYDRYQRAVFP